MSITSETREIRQTVTVIHCDGPDCNQEVVRDRFESDTVPPYGWYKVDWRQVAPMKDDGGPWHFHTMACLNAWAHERRYRETK